MSAAKALREAACSLVLSNRPTAVLAERIVLDERFLQRILQNEAFPRRLAANRELCEALASSLRRNQGGGNGKSSSLLAMNCFVEALLADTSAVEQVISDPRGVVAFLRDSRAMDWILSDAGFLNDFLMEGRLSDSILGHDAFLNDFLMEERLSEKLLGHDAFLDVFLTEERLPEKILANRKALDGVAFDGRLLDQPGVYERMNALIEFERAWGKLSKHARVDDPDYGEKLRRARESVKRMSNIPDAILSLLCEGNDAILAKGTLEFPERHSFWILLQEILFGEEHYFETEEEAPRILDCGMHFGLSMYFFKSLFPKARITGFEPVPELAELVERNISRNDYADVEVLQYAISDREEETVFKISEDDSMAGSLTDRRSGRGDAIKEITVQCRRLSDYLNEPVNFLKIDIEGMEDKVLEEAAPLLKNVEHLFCEYHHLPGQASDRMAKILGVLTEAGFETHVGQPAAIQQYVKPRPKSFMKQPYSALIWAKNLNW